ncbi:tetratricopeptide repeat protein [Pyxidicoccus sp. MSG2]|uniref:tetratricopeptide repeat protein n=1 Tax=Pyxidicoccus sp. MSG2 TaxID=2996790 RepID=UPI00226FB133|nr:tetratricopeptide repeat protein [Pyxidicoccus sp. MSG2]MCY1021359.1 tetratricopeptide repeat protein [Pyxidicoccus sp. MSG2]
MSGPTKAMTEPAAAAAPEPVDVLIVTALKREYEAVLRVETGAVPGRTWVQAAWPGDLDVASRVFQGAEGAPLRVVVARSLGIGVVAMTGALSMLVDTYAPRCLAMCGIGAGLQAEVELGDVIIADVLWAYALGQNASGSSAGEESSLFQSRSLRYLLDAKLRHKAEHFQPSPESPWRRERPRTYEAQMDWILDCLWRGESPALHPQRKERCADYSQVLPLLWEQKLVSNGELSLTPEGRRYIERKRLLYPDGLPEPRPFRVHVGALVTVDTFVRTPEVFDRLAHLDRKVLGLDMEAAAIGALARIREAEYTVVLKGIADFADSAENDRFRDFAARAAAECLLEFLRSSLPPAPLGHFSDLLDTGISERPRVPSPAALLNAHYRCFPFWGRKAELERLQAWCQSEEPASAWLIHARGGMGKTRLLVEVCEQLRMQGWRAGFLAHSPRPERLEALLASAQDTLVVIDSAESEPGLPGYLELIAQKLREKRQGRFRLVLLARSVGDWWSDIIARSKAINALLDSQVPMELPPLMEGSLAARQELFLEAVRCFASIRKRSGLGLVPPDLSDEQFERVMYIHMAALAAVEGRPSSAMGLIEGLLAHEERLWLARAHATATTEQARRSFLAQTRRAVTAFTLLGGASSQQEVEELLQQVNEEQDESLMLMLRDLYPGNPRDSWRASISGLEPDVMGDAMVLHTLRLEVDGGRRLLEKVFSNADARALRNGFEVLGRLSREHPDEAGPWIQWVLESDVPSRALAAFDAAKALAARGAHTRLGAYLAQVLEKEGTPLLAAQMESMGFPADAVSLHDVMRWVTRTRLQNLEEEEGLEHLAERARLLNNLGSLQSESGRREEALATIEQAVKHYRAHAARQPELFQSDLALSLNNLGVMLRELGRMHEALAVTQEAVSLHSRLAQEQDASLPNLAMSLNNLGGVQWGLGQREQALKAFLEAVAISRNLAAKVPDAFLPSLAGGLNNLGNILQTLGRREEALMAAQEAVAISRNLAERNPETFLPSLAMGLNNLGIHLVELGRQEESSAAIREAVEIYRQLARRTPEAFQPDLARSLSNLGLLLNAQGAKEVALQAAHEALEIIWPYFERFPSAFAMQTNNILQNLLAWQSELKLPTTSRHQAQLDAVQKALSQ